MLYVIDRNAFVAAVISSIKKWDQDEFIKRHLCCEDYAKLSEDPAKYTEDDLMNAMDNAPEFRFAFAADQLTETFRDIFAEPSFEKALKDI